MTICEFSWLDSIVYVYQSIVLYGIIWSMYGLSHYVPPAGAGARPPACCVPPCSPYLPSRYLILCNTNIVCFLF